VQPDRYFNRELSWLDFDGRVLELAADVELPLLERVKLCAIFSSNLDEFAAVRLSGIGRQVESKIRRRSVDGRTPAQTLKDVCSRIFELQSRQDQLWLGDLQPALAAEGIRIGGVEDCSPRELRVLTKRFEREVQPLLTPIAVGVGAPFPYVTSLALNIGLLVRDDSTSEQRFMRVNVPDDVGRFLEVGADGLRIPVEEAILHFTPTLVRGVEILGHSTFRVTRDADLSLLTDADDLMEAIETQVAQRRYGDVVRVEIAAGAPQELVDILVRQLTIGPERTCVSEAPLGLGAAMELTAIDRPDLKNKPWRPVTRRPFVNRRPAELLTRIRRRDILVHHPYDSFDTSVEAFVAAARDSKVAALKGTVYRTGNPSAMLSSLVETAEEGKQAVCLVELKARFDERRNIEWSKALERAGVDVVYGVPDLKVHAKLTLLVRRERGGVRRYVHIGTGNYHASHATSYEDLGLFTADDEIAADVAEVFNAVTGRTRPAVFRKLLVGPWFLREGILNEIDCVVRAAEAGEAGRIRIKVNALVDPEVIDALYHASAAGVRVEIITRGICALRPGVPGLSERITVRSVLGRFLEHSRIFSFQTNDRTKTWIGSADLMPRNLDRRIEVLMPVEDSRLRSDVAEVLDALLADTRFSWELDQDGAWHRTQPRRRTAAVSAQELLMTRATKRAKKRSSGQRAQSQPVAPADFILSG
jgi:polyphosphate kinase